MTFHLVSDFKPAGDQPFAIDALVQGLKNAEHNQVLLGVTGSGKTFTMGHVIQNTQRPALILAHNKTLAAQIYAEMKSFFPHNAVEYFVSYYDYYQPEAYVPRTDTYIEKESTINREIDRMRHSATRALLERPDVIIVASVSCIYGIGAVESYSQMVLHLKAGEPLSRDKVSKDLTQLQYKRNDMALLRGNFRLRGDVLEIFPAHYEDRAWRLSFFDQTLESIFEVDPLTGKKISALDHVIVYPNSHYVTPGPTLRQAIVKIRQDLEIRLQEFERADKRLESQRLRERVTFDLEMLTSTGMCAGIENYSRYLTGRSPGSPPPTLFEYLPQNTLLIVDESHVSVPQLGSMYKGDIARKKNLAEYGFRLPSCADNRPLTFEEWNMMRPQTIFVSATPGPWELEQASGVFVEQVIRPTGLLDPICTVRPTQNQVDNLLYESQKAITKGHRVLVTTLTKKMAEALSEYFHEAGVHARYLHSDVDTLERIEIIQDLRRGTFDVLIGINLLREGLDIPECALIGILDADKEGFLRSQTALVQTIGRAARHVDGQALLYADKITKSLGQAIEETNRRREKQHAYNLANNLSPTSISKAILPHASEVNTNSAKRSTVHFKSRQEKISYLEKIEKQMLDSANNLDFEEAIRLRNTLRTLQEEDLATESS